MYNTLDNNLAEVEAKKQGNRVRDVQAQAFFDTLSERLAEVKVATVGETLTNLKAALPVLTLFLTLAVMKPADRLAYPALPPPARPMVKTLGVRLAKKT